MKEYNKHCCGETEDITDALPQVIRVHSPCRRHIYGTVTKVLLLADDTNVTATRQLVVPKIDRTVPVLRVEASSGDSEYESGVWTTQDVLLTFINQANTKGNTRLYAYIEGQPGVQLFYNDGYAETDARNLPWLMGGAGSAPNYTYDTTQNVTYCYQLVSESGLTSEIVRLTVALDKSAPVISNPYVKSGSTTTLLNALTFNLFFREAEIVVPVTDQGSGIARVEMILTPVPGGGEAITYTRDYLNPASVNASFDLDINFKGHITLKANLAEMPNSF